MTLLESWPHQIGYVCVCEWWLLTSSTLMTAMEVSEMLIYELAMTQTTTQEHFNRLICLYIIISEKFLHPLSNIFIYTNSTYIFLFQVTKTF